MEHLSETQREELREQLEGQRMKIHGDRKEELKSVGQRQAMDVGDTQDAASGEESRQRSVALLAKYDHMLGEIEDALRRLEHRTFGFCEETDEPIPYDRLRVHPATRYTVTSQELLESRRGGDKEETSAY